jgi:hypothetical protein
LQEELESHTPLTYVYFDVAAASAGEAGRGGAAPPAARDVEFFFETPGQMATDKDSQTVAWARDGWAEGTSHLSMSIGVAAQRPFSLTDYWIDPRQPAEHIDWGQAHLTLPHAVPATRTYNVSSWMGSSNLARSTFAATGALPIGGDDLAMPEPACGNVTSGYYVCTCGNGMRGGNDYPTETFDDPIPGDLWPAIASSFRLGSVRRVARRAVAVISHDDLGLSARYFGQVLPEIWRRDGQTFDELLMGASAGAAAAIAACERYDEKLVAKFYAAVRTDLHVHHGIDHNKN